jgi:transcriptional regulator with GAF, ATPase, and Fis domain
VTTAPDITLERHPFELRVLTEVAKTLTARLPLADVLSRAMERLNASLSPADVGILYLWDDRAELFHAAASFGCDADALSEIGLHRGESVTGRVFAEGQPRLYTTAESIAAAMGNLSPGNRQWLGRALGTESLPRNVLAAPLRVADEAFGVLQLYTQRQHLHHRRPALHPDAGRPDGPGD